jgi:hypothetical protein
VSVLTGFLSAVGRLWARGCLGKGAVIVGALIVLGMCSSLLGGNRTPPAAAPVAAITPSAPSPQSTIAPAAATTAPVPTAEVLVQLATAVPTAEPTDAPEPTSPPAATRPPVLGQAPQGSDCPADHPVKGNIVDRGANKGEKIYHVPGSPSYAATKPERCFVDAKEAESAGFRAPK